MDIRNLSLTLVLGIFLLLYSCSKEPKDSTTNTVNSTNQTTTNGSIKLTSIAPAQSGIQFNNQVQDNPNLNYFIWNFVYSGAGVAAGDLNNDGLPDLFFGGNLVDDKIYFNKGNFKFEDVTAKSRINPKLWTTGVTMADVNNDGWLDIYVCKNSPTSLIEKNRNKLWINNKNGTFSEQAQQYGISDTGFSIQASFFDVDNDGDLDLYLINQPFDAFSKILNNPQAVQNYPATDRLFLMENGKFVDKTAAFNLTNARYGLNIALGDFDLNGWTDFYICNDYDGADQLFMNRNGRFKDEIHSRTGHTSFFSMGSDVADINSDGQLDLVSVDMAFPDHFRSKTNMETMDPERFWNYVKEGKHYQFPTNNLQINQGNGVFKEVSQLSGISKTDWSWATLFVDLNANTKPDLLVTNGILKDLKNNDTQAYLMKQYGGKIDPSSVQDAVSKMPVNPIANMLFENKGDLQFEDISNASGFNLKGFSQGMASADFDQDGQMDIVVNNMNGVASLYKNSTTGSGNYLMVKLKGKSQNLNALGTTVIAYHNGQAQINTMQSTRGYFSSSEPILHFGFGNTSTIDSLKIIWDHKNMTVLKNVKTNQRLTVDYSKAAKVPFVKSVVSDIVLKSSKAINYKHQENNFNDFEAQVLLPYKLSQNGPFITKGDLNNDQLEDLFIGGAAGFPSQIFQQNQNGSFTKMSQPDLTKDKAYEDMEASFHDFNKDGFIDLFVSSGSNEFKDGNNTLQNRIYFNNKKGVLQKQNNALPKHNINGQSHLIFDMDGDEDLDIFVGGRLVSGKYPAPANSAIWINEDGKWLDQTKVKAPFLKEFGLVTDAVHTDIDGDGDEDIVVVGEWMTPTILINHKNRFVERPIKTAGTGIWWSINQADFDKDGDVDFVLGNLGWNNKFGGKNPTLEVYSNDFDNDGDYDVVLANTKDAKTYPVRGRECSSQEMPFILEKFPSYEAYGNAELKDILTADQLEKSISNKVETFSSMVLLNNGEYSFTKQYLPATCQVGPIKSFEILDINKDGNMDLIYGGNHFPAEVETTRYDALNFGFCYGNGDGTFKPATHSTNDVNASIDVRDLEVVTMQNGKRLLVVAVNDGEVECFQIE